MTKALPGNPHYSEAATFRASMTTSALNRLAEAQLAVAYEQRTANLIAVVTAHHEPVGVRLTEVEFEVLRDQIRDRLGLNNDG